MSGEELECAGGFGAALRDARGAKKLTLLAFARQINYSKGHVSKIECSKARPTPEFVEKCDTTLGMGGQLVARYEADHSSAGTVARPTKVPPVDIPPLPYDFVGRGAEADQLISAIGGRPESHRATTVLIHGMPGVGKTALAQHVAHRVQARFPDGCLFVTFEGSRDQELEWNIHGRLLRRLGMAAGDIPTEPDEARACFLSFLHPRRVLIVADGVTNADQVTSLVTASPDCAVIATSQQRLDVLEDCHRTLLQPLSGSDAAGLLRVVSGRSDLGAEADVL
ncbi:helix-turn-helix domain-containing protein, partial [Frankia sp. CiP3]|uniref:helix-turn-helix domain-containing protein n=1 Tax=Frankia sp. CiP3 TaxID=2880971 RepID=UPI001EF688CE